MKKIKLILPLLAIMSILVTGCGIFASKNNLDIQYKEEEAKETPPEEEKEENTNTYKGIMVGSSSLNSFIKTTSSKSTYQSDSSDDYDEFGEPLQTASKGATAPSSGTTSNTTVESTPKYQQMVIEGYYMRYKIDPDTNSVEESVSIIEKQIDKYKGYIENMEMHCSDEKDEEGKKKEKSEAAIYIRIPTENLYDFIKSLDNGKIINGTIVERQKESKEVTTDYISTITHIETLKLKRERLMTLLEKANDLDTILKLEDRISDVEYDITFYEDKKNTFENLVEYTQVRIDIEDNIIEEKEIPEEPEEPEPIEEPSRFYVDPIILGFLLMCIGVFIYLLIRLKKM